MTARTLAFRAAVVLIPLALAGCPIPLVPGDESGSRQNLGDKVPDFIITGKTTRADVLLALGEPDGESEHGEWFAYTRRTSTGGVMLIMAGGYSAGGASNETMNYRRLIIQFDDANIVKSARHELVTCSEWQILRDEERREPIWVPPCERTSGQYYFPTDSVGEHQGQTFAPASWYQGLHGFEWRRIFLLTPEPKPSLGILVVGERSILFFSPNADSKSEPLFKAPYTDIMDVHSETLPLGLNRRIVIKHISGVYESFSIDKGVRVDVKLTESAGELIKSRWQAATSRPQVVPK